jgi:hypothetical protein
MTMTVVIVMVVEQLAAAVKIVQLVNLIGHHMDLNAVIRHGVSMA